MVKKIVTIGVFGFTEAGFFNALQKANVDTFCDVRQRRGVRGAKYAFVNSLRLQAKLAELNIRYLHLKNLAPTTAVRQRQHEADQAAKTAKRQRTTLSPNFILAYQEEILSGFRAQSMLDVLPPNAKIIALFCVEREPAACHRSLIADHLNKQLDIEVVHILP